MSQIPIVTCPHCEGEYESEQSIDEASVDQDGDSLTFYLGEVCDHCGDEFSLICYATIHTYEVERNRG